MGIGTTSPDNPLSVMGERRSSRRWFLGQLSRRPAQEPERQLQFRPEPGLQKIHPVRYRYKADNPLGIRDTDEHIGVVAQRVRQVIPEAVTGRRRCNDRLV